MKMYTYIGIITAQDEEMLPIREKLEEVSINVIHDLTFYEGKIKNIQYILVKSGIGKVNAARSAQIMIDNYSLEYIINIGCAGALNDGLDIYDWVIGKTLIQYDFDITAFGHNMGYIPNIGEELYSSDELIKSFTKKLQRMSNDGSKVIAGKIATGDGFCTDISLKNEIQREFRG